ncbi:hypothetical protein [Mycolicibacterium mengxianglii]|uniref:hypothetical protein n=1 Tax=Mycolicibacterium mengxianglii TaxID=2736649 RepID=UPI0018D15239|nr:hypothetical protein [Mycolicibacterium mengxianglii]
MATMNEHRRQWWDRLTEDQRARVRAAAETREMTAETLKLLGDTGCPLGAVGTQVAGGPVSGWSWAESTRQFILASS